MNKIVSIILSISLLFALDIARADFNPKEAKKSLVKVMVTGNGKAGVCTGFVWKEGNQVVTSLHAMRQGAQVKVLYLDQFWRSANVSKVFKEADLVLLEVEGSVPAGVVPLTGYNQGEIPYSTNIHTIGYNDGAKGSSSRLLTKGYVDPETLESLIPEKDRNEIHSVGFPSLNLEIIYLDGSLLPGYSGSPVFDKAGNLVGIGNGGLESGQSNVSWVIPAKFLAQLENSQVKQLPGNISQASQSFSASTEIEVKSEDLYDDMDALEEQFAEEYTNYYFGEYEFIYTKTRTFDELYNSSLDPDNLAMMAMEFENNNILVDYDFLKFDIYEEINNGVVLAVPFGYELYYDPETEVLNARSTFPQEQNFNMVFAGGTDDFSNMDKSYAVETLIEQISENVGFQVGGLTVDEEYSYDIHISDDYYIAWVLLNGNTYMTGADGQQYAMTMYCTVLVSNDKVFYTLASALLPVDQAQQAMLNGIDCEEGYDLNPTGCELFESYLKLMCAAHMTTFANKMVVKR